jgi:ribosomal 50S subunit-associated protein YjgA (DUF615 family)
MTRSIEEYSKSKNAASSFLNQQSTKWSKKKEKKQVFPLEKLSRDLGELKKTSLQNLPF